MTRYFTLPIGRASIPGPVAEAAKTAAVIYALSISVAVIVWSAVSFPFFGPGFLWLAALGTAISTADAFAAGAILYAAVRHAGIVDRAFLNRPIVAGSLVFASFGVGSAAIAPFVDNAFLPYSHVGAITGLLVGLSVAILTKRGHIHHDPQ